MAIGNFSIGRGYDPNVLPADRGIAGSLDAVIGPFGSEQLRVSPFAFFDALRVTSLGSQGSTRTLTSFGGGIRARVLDRFDLGLTYARPLTSTFVGGARPPARLLFNATVRIF